MKSIKFISDIFIALFIISIISCTTTNESINALEILNTEKQKGAHVFGHLDSTNYHFLKEDNIDWVTLVPWGFQKEYNSGYVSHNSRDSIQTLKSNKKYIDRLKMIKGLGFKIFLKPHVWINNEDSGKWRSDIFHNNNEDWEKWKSDYRQFILRYAAIAEAAEVEMFCIGTEFTRLTLEKPQYWIDLIQEVRSIYKGKLTYAANWYKEYESIEFWSDLDFIGIQAYFPLSETPYPNVDILNRGWEKYLGKFEQLSHKFNRPIIFTEMGYKSTSHSAIRPWEWAEKNTDNSIKYCAETQTNCYAAFFESVYIQDWFAGVHIWQVRPDAKERFKKGNLDFTPQDKPAESIIRNAFKE